MALKSNALTTVARLKVYLDITGSSKDSVLEALINAGSDFIESYCKRTFKRTAYSNELYDGMGRDTLVLKNFPVISGQTFTLQQRSGGFNTGSWETVDSDTYAVDYDSGVIKRIKGDWTMGNITGSFHRGTQNFRVTYTAGFYLPQDASYDANESQQLPMDLEMSVWELCSSQYNRRKSAGVSSERVRDVSISYAKDLMENAAVRGTLDRYRKKSYK